MIVFVVARNVFDVCRWRETVLVRVCLRRNSTAREVVFMFNNVRAKDGSEMNIYKGKWFKNELSNACMFAPLNSCHGIDEILYTVPRAFGRVRRSKGGVRRSIGFGRPAPAFFSNS